MPSEAFLSNLVLLVLHVARGSAAEAEAMNMSRGVTTFSRIVMSCGNVIRAYVAKNGDAGIKFLETFAKNKTGLIELVGADEADVGRGNGRLGK